MGLDKNAHHNKKKTWESCVLLPLHNYALICVGISSKISKQCVVAIVERFEEYICKDEKYDKTNLYVTLQQDVGACFN